ncbi:MAG: tRNA (cytidine(34)-2'-O)-methyltransferase [Desulfobacteraceae bacterium]|nr:tRNA (cytidine(34)-2'-O)-methyltransferase [Desulfobacteraceae bacterium]
MDTSVPNPNHFERHVVLVAPEVHWNTGNIGRTCLGADAFLHLIKPLGFSLDSREVKRAGLDYWDKVKLAVWEDFDCFMRSLEPKAGEVALFTKNGAAPFWNMPDPGRMFLIFGSETKGLSDEILSLFEPSTYFIPTSKAIRCLNLSTAVGIALYESLRHARVSHEWKPPAISR